MKKKTFSILMALLLLFSLFAVTSCGGDGNPEDTAVTSGSVQLPENGDVIP